MGKMEILDSVEKLSGVGPKRLKSLEDLGIFTIYDVLTHFPFRYENTQLRNLHEILDQEKVTLKGMVVTEPVVSYYGFKKSRLYFRMAVQESVITVTFFNQPYLKNKIEQGKELLLFGKWDEKRSTLMGMKILGNSSDTELDEFEAVYRVSKTIKQTTLLKLVQEALHRYQSVIPEPLPKEIQEKYHLIPHKKAIEFMHFPTQAHPASEASWQLIYQELFIYQLGLAQMKLIRHKKQKGIQIRYDNQRLKDCIQRLPFELTSGQKQVVNEICYDLLAPYEMNRLLQGDVGSGKTVVALIALLATIFGGYQGALMVPTEILAEQHFMSIAALCQGFGIHIQLLTGSTNAKQRALILEELKKGQIDLLIGTHTLFQKDVFYQRLGLVVIDEQHRFGVNQRKALTSKGRGVNVLHMTATPIPRTLAITAFGDMDLSILKELPKGRQPVQTRWVPDKDLSSVFTFLEKEVSTGRQGYVVSPLIEESETLDVQNAEEIYRMISSQFHEQIKIGLLHGRMKNEEKDKVMSAFQKNEIQVLVSTTVIEVGVDVPNATTMIILNADRFGLAQLHQLRGRIGRGKHASSCILVASPKTENGKKRMKIMCESTDGFYLSQKDMELRGSGDIFGVKQSGIPDFQVADLIRDYEILERARQDALQYMNEMQDQPFTPDLQMMLDYQQKKRSKVGDERHDNQNSD